MSDLLWLIPALPLAGALSLGVLGRRLPRRLVAAIGTGSVGLAALAAAAAAAGYAAAPGSVRLALWTWIRAGAFEPRMALHLDALSLVMVLVVTGVGFLIHLYSAEFMAGEAGYARFFATMNLFTAAMLVLVLADDLLLLYLGWEGVGLSSYLLIGFWYRDPANGRAARKAFAVTRVGDTALAIGLLLLFTELGTLDLSALGGRAAAAWPVGSGPAVAAAALLLAGAASKSAQLPFQVWLPDAMAGPTPVSALLHAATMVTAGVYLIARTHALFALAPAVLAATAAIGAVTLLLGAASALVQSDLKRVLAWSTVSQIGYMFLALGVGAWAAAIFHFVTHAFFKALLFLGAGAVILCARGEHDVHSLGGLGRKLPLVGWTFAIGAASLSGLPLVTAGFYSKDWILWEAWSSPQGGSWLAAAGLLGVLLTALYAFRAVFLVFPGEPRGSLSHVPGPAIRAPLVVLAALSLLAGFLQTPPTLGGAARFQALMAASLPVRETHGTPGAELGLQLSGALLALAGVVLAYLFFAARPGLAGRWARRAAPLRRLWLGGWGFDALYDRALVRPLGALVRVSRGEVVDAAVDALGRAALALHRTASATETGRLRRYAAGLAAGAAFFLLLAVLA